MKKKQYQNHGYDLAGPDRGENGCLFADSIVLLSSWIVEIKSASQSLPFSDPFGLFTELVDVFLFS